MRDDFDKEALDGLRNAMNNWAEFYGIEEPDIKTGETDSGLVVRVNTLIPYQDSGDMDTLLDDSDVTQEEIDALLEVMGSSSAYTPNDEQVDLTLPYFRESRKTDDKRRLVIPAHVRKELDSELVIFYNEVDEQGYVTQLHDTGHVTEQFPFLDDLFAKEVQFDNLGRIQLPNNFKKNKEYLIFSDNKPYIQIEPK